MEELGKKLLEQRQARGISLQEISSATHISIGVLKDIEGGQFEKYAGDEEYIKKYIEKYAEYLNIDSTEYIDSYVTLTKEINTAKIRASEEKIKNEPKKKQVTMTKPNFAHSKKVYDNHRGLEFVKYSVIVALCLLIIFSVWYVLRLSNKADNQFGDQNTSHISGEVETPKEDDKTVTLPEDQTKQEETKEESKIKVEHTANYEYTITLPKDMETFDFKFEFVGCSWSQLTVNGIDGSNLATNGLATSNFDSKTFNSVNSANDPNATPETIIVSKMDASKIQTVTLMNGHNYMHRYFINDTKIDVLENENNGSSDPSTLTFKFVKES